MSAMKKHPKKSISIKHIRSPKVAFDKQVIDKLVQEVIGGRSLSPLKVTKAGYENWDPVYELATPVQPKDALSLAVAKRVQEIRPNENSHMVCYVE